MSRTGKNSTHTLRSFRAIWVAGMMLGIGLVGLLTLPAQAGPITSPYSSPYTKLGVYQGVISIVPASGSSVLEIGNAGRDIASSGNLYIRPGLLSPDGTFPTNTIAIYAESGKANLWLGLGRICLGNTGNCRNTWPTGGAADPNWTVTGTPSRLQPTTITHAVRIGSFINPVPQSSGRALEIYASRDSAAVNLPGGLITGDGSQPTSGRTRIFGQLRVPSGQLYAYGFNFIVPWNSENDDDAGFDPYDFSWNINTDTFDGDTVLPFNKATHDGRQYHDLLWKKISVGATSAFYLCLHTPDNWLCQGGSNPGQTCSGAGGFCPGGGVCTQFCSAEQQSCARDNLPWLGETPQCYDGATYRPVADCGACGFGEACVWGRFITYSSFVTSCNLTTCENLCAGQTKCTGTQDASCSFGGTPAYNDDAQCSQIDIGQPPSSCWPNGNVSPLPEFTCGCDCLLTNDTPYYNAVQDQGSDLCTEAFQ